MTTIDRQEACRYGAYTAPSCVVIRPELRDSDIERDSVDIDGSEITVYWTLNETFPPQDLDSDLFRKGGYWRTVKACVGRSIRTIVVPEPLWVRYWPQTVLVVLTARAVRFALRRPKADVALYAIENMRPAERLTLPRLDQTPWLNKVLSVVARPLAMWTLKALVDRIAFGTAQAESNYRSAGFIDDRRTRTALIPETHGICQRCFKDLTLPPYDDRESRVLFLGQLATRKGVDTLLEAWRLSDLAAAGWKLTICGTGPLRDDVQEAADTEPTIELRSPTRDEIHALLSTSKAVVLPSRTVPRWQEQVGLSMLEGESHGCALIVSRESGAAIDLGDRAFAQIIDPNSALSLASALNRLPSASPAQPGTGDSAERVRAFLKNTELAV